MPSGMLSLRVSKQVEGPGTRDAPRDLASLLPALPVEKRFADPASPAGCCATARHSGVFKPPGSVEAAGVQAGIVQPGPSRHEDVSQGEVCSPLPDPSCTPGLQLCSTGLFTLACIHPAPLNSDQLPSCEVDVCIIRRGGEV